MYQVGREAKTFLSDDSEEAPAVSKTQIVSSLEVVFDSDHTPCQFAFMNDFTSEITF